MEVIDGTFHFQQDKFEKFSPSKIGSFHPVRHCDQQGFFLQLPNIRRTLKLLRYIHTENVIGSWVELPVGAILVKRE